MAMATLPTPTVTDAASKMRYREAVATRATGKQFGEPLSDEAFAELRESLGILPVELEKNLGDSFTIDRYVGWLAEVRECKARRPKLLAEKGAILERHKVAGFPRSVAEEVDRENELAEIEKRDCRRPR